jgi:hypothetical protein
MRLKPQLVGEKWTLTKSSGDLMTFCEVVFHEGNIDTLLGPPGAGKTNCALFLGEKAVDSGFFIYTNIHFFKFSDVTEACNKNLLPKGVKYRKTPLEITTVKTLSDLLLGLLKTDKNVVMLDEAGIFASSTAPMATRVRELKELAYVIRHLRSSLLLIAQSKGSISPALRTELVTYEMRIRRLSKFYRTLIVSKAFPIRGDDGEEEVQFVPIGPAISKIPLTRYPWDSFFIPKFDFDIKLSDAFSCLGEKDSVEIRKKDREGITLGERIIMELKGREQKEEDIKAHKENRRDEIRNKFLAMAESGSYTKRSDIFAELARENKRTYNWAYQLCRDLPF